MTNPIYRGHTFPRPGRSPVVVDINITESSDLTKSEVKKLDKAYNDFIAAISDIFLDKP